MILNNFIIYLYGSIETDAVRNSNGLWVSNETMEIIIFIFVFGTVVESALSLSTFIEVDDLKTLQT